MYTMFQRFTPPEGVRCSFRNWSADGKERSLEMVSLCFAAIFECSTTEDLTKEGWLYPEPFEQELNNTIIQTFDARIIIANDDPRVDDFMSLYIDRVINKPTLLPQVGMPHFACWMAVTATDVLSAFNRYPKTRVHRASVWDAANDMNVFWYTPEHKYAAPSYESS